MTQSIKLNVISTTFVLMIIMSLIVSSAHIREENLIWKIQDGDTMTYNFMEYYDYGDYGDDGDLYARIYEGVTIKKGTTMKVNITDISDEFQIPALVTLNDGENETTFSLDYVDVPLYASYYGGVSKITENQTYWEELAQKWTFNETNSEKIPPGVEPIVISIREVILEGDLVVNSIKMKRPSYFTLEEILTKHNRKTGWLTYYSLKRYNLTVPEEWNTDVLLFEWTYSARPKSSIPSFNGIPVILGIFFIIFARTITGRLFTRRSR